MTQSVPTNIETVVTTDGDSLLFATATRTDTLGTIDVDETSAFKQLQASSSIRLYDGLANYYRIGAAHDVVRADELNAMYTSTVVQEGVIEAYYNLLRAQLLLDVAANAVGVAQEQLERTQALYDLGSAVRSDVLKSQVQLGENRLLLVQARNGERLVRTGLVYAMNLFGRLCARWLPDALGSRRRRHAHQSADRRLDGGAPAAQFAARTARDGGWLYGIAAVGLGVYLLALALGVVRRHDTARARRVFFGSIIYLPLLFGILVLDTLLV